MKIEIVGGTSLMLRMWGDDVSAPLNAVHLGYGFGAVFANLLVKPFLGHREILGIGPNNETLFIDNIGANIQVPYSIISFICLLIAVGHLIFSILEYRNRRESVENRPVDYSSVPTKVVEEKKVSEYSPRLWGNGSFNYGLNLSIIFIFYMFFLSGNDQTFGKFFFTFLKTPKFGIPSQDAAYGMVIYWLSYSVFILLLLLKSRKKNFFRLGWSFNLCSCIIIYTCSLRFKWFMDMWIYFSYSLVYNCMDF